MLVVTGAYDPEISGGGIQARELIRALRDRVDFTVLTTTSIANEAVRVDDIPVYRIAVDPTRLGSRVRGLLRLGWLLVRVGRASDVVHLQGFSSKNIVITVAARLLGARVLLVLQTGVHDDPGVVKTDVRLGFWSVMNADVVVAVSEALRECAARAGVAPDRLRTIPNGVDTMRFHPPSVRERQALRRRLSLPEDKAIILFVGFFSRDKGPHRLFAAWNGLPPPVRDRAMLVFVGQTKPPHPEIDPTLAESIRHEARGMGPAPRFVERTHEIDAYYGAADVFVLPSVREGCPNALLEAMATGLPVIGTRLPGSTDSMITDGTDGRLVAPGDVDALRSALSEVLTDSVTASAYGAAARATACRRFSLARVSEAYLEIYRTLGAS